MFCAIGDFDAVSFRDITTDSDLMNKMAVFEVTLGSLTGLSHGQYLTYNAHLAWTQVNGSHSRILAMQSSYGLAADHEWCAVPGHSDGTVEKVPRDGTSYRISVPVYNLGEGRLLVNLTINLYCTNFTIGYLLASIGYICACSQWQLRWISDSLEISAKRG